MTVSAPTPAPSVPTTVDEAILLLEEFAWLAGRLSAIEEKRTKLIAAANLACDQQANGLVDQRAALQAVLQTWWGSNAAALTKGKRKSIELGGCMIGSKAGRASLAVEGDEKAIVEKLGKRAWAADLLKVTTSIDKVATLKALAGEHARKLMALGFAQKDGVETFILERAEQPGTRAATA